MRWLDGGDGDSLAGRHGSPPLVDGTVVSLLGGGLRPLLLSGPAGLLLCDLLLDGGHTAGGLGSSLLH